MEHIGREHKGCNSRPAGKEVLKIGWQVWSGSGELYWKALQTMAAY